MVFFLQGLTLGFSASVAPGPFQAYLLTQALKLGARRALPLAVVPLLSDGPIVTLVLIALSQMPSGLLRALQIAGGVFLLYLAWSAFQAARAASAPASAGVTAQRSLGQGVLMNLLNPNPWLFWSVIGGPLILAAWAQAPANALLFGLGFYLTLITGTGALILLFATAHRLDPRLARGLNLVAALALAVFGLLQLGRGLGWG